MGVLIASMVIMVRCQYVLHVVHVPFPPFACLPDKEPKFAKGLAEEIGL